MNKSYSKQLNERNRQNREARMRPPPPKKGKARKVSTMTQARSALDANAQKYVRLLADPCNAPLTEGIYAGTGGGIVSRFESDFIIGTAALATGGMILWTPGLGLVYNNSTVLVTDTTNTNFAPLFTASGFLPPGFGFLSTTAQSFRCVAACAQMSYPGSEQLRSGVISMGIMDSGTVAGLLPVAAGGENTLTNSGFLRQLSQHSERAPAAMAEIKWFPGEQDGRFFSYGPVAASLPTNPTSNVDHEGRNSIALGWSGYPVTVGCRIRLVVVCEWNPAVNLGIVATVQPKYSRASVVEVLTRMAKANPNWFLHASQALGMVMGNIPIFKTSNNFRVEL